MYYQPSTLTIGFLVYMVAGKVVLLHSVIRSRSFWQLED